MTERRWSGPPHPDSPAYTTAAILSGERSIVGVAHNLNGDWQFVDGEALNAEDGVVVHLHHIVEEHPDLTNLLDLPAGWEAWKGAEPDEWTRNELPRDMR